MKNTILLSFVSLFFVLIFSIPADAQITLQVGGGLGYVLPSGDFGGSASDFYNGSKYGQESGFNVHAKARAGFAFLNAFGEIGYSSFSGSGDVQAGGGSADISQEVFTIKLGPEFPISIPMSPVAPYLQAFVSYNAFSGSVDFTGVSGIPSGSYDIASASRIGVGGGAGAVFSLGVMKLDLSIQYHALNLTGKEYKIETVTSHERLDNYTSLNDGKDPAYAEGNNEHFIKDDRGIEAIEFKATLLFGL